MAKQKPIVSDAFSVEDDLGLLVQTETGLIWQEDLDRLIENPEAGLDEEDLAFMKELEELGKEDEPEEVVPETVAEVVPVKKKKTKNYVNNGDLLIQHKLSKEQDSMTNELAKMLQMMAERYSMKPKYREYSYVEDMRAYSMMMIVRTWRSFKVEKSTNAFAFFTQCIKNSFKQYLKHERKQRDIRDEMLIDAGLNPSYTYSEDYGSGGSDDSFGGRSNYDN